MAKVLIVYGSTTGNTEMVAEELSDNLGDHEVEVQDVAETSPEDLTAYDLLVLGSSTWDDGLLQPDFREFVEDLDVDLSGKKVAIFGLGDSNYPDFCEAANILEEKVSAMKGELAVDTLRIDGFPDEPENETKVEAWAAELSKAV